VKPQLVIPEISLQLLKFWAASNLDVLHTHFNWRCTLPLCIVQYVFKVKLHMCGRLTVVVLIIIVLVYQHNINNYCANNYCPISIITRLSHSLGDTI